MLRTQTEAMSATLGGVNSLTVKAFDSVFRESNEFGERIARNQQLLLKEEAHFEKIVDPAAGSYYIENLTSMLAGEAWDLFIEIEKRGGFLEALSAGYIQDEVEKTASLRNTNVARGREKLLGTNSFPNTKEKRSEELPAKKDPGQTEIRPVKIYRAAEMFEELRYAVDNSDKIPKVFMLTVGNPVMRKARAQFSSGFFAVAGYEIIDNIGFDTLEDGVNAALKAKADIVVLCSSDEEYADAGPGAHRLLGDKSLLVIAGEPACEKELRDAGIEYFISMRSDLLSTLSGFNKVLGINR
jgi:methylmalonyl-CoA mutase